MEITLQEASKQYLETLKGQGKSARTLYTYGKDLEQIAAFFGPEKPVSVMTLTLGGKFLKSDVLLRLPDGKERAPQTIAKTIRVFRDLTFWLKAEGHLDTIPLPKTVPLGRKALK